MAPTVHVTFDAADPHALADFWAQAAGYDREDHSGVIAGLLEAGHLDPGDVIEDGDRQAFRDLAACRDPQGRRPRLLFQRVPEAKVAKNRVHLDLQVGGAEAARAEADRLVAAGANVRWTTSDRGPLTITLADPEATSSASADAVAPATTADRGRW